jgi:hypothetical protein
LKTNKWSLEEIKGTIPEITNFPCYWIYKQHFYIFSGTSVPDRLSTLLISLYKINLNNNFCEKVEYKMNDMEAVSRSGGSAVVNKNW